MATARHRAAHQVGPSPRGERSLNQPGRDVKRQRIPGSQRGIICGGRRSVAGASSSAVSTRASTGSELSDLRELKEENTLGTHRQLHSGDALEKSELVRAGDVLADSATWVKHNAMLNQDPLNDGADIEQGVEGSWTAGHDAVRHIALDSDHSCRPGNASGVFCPYPLCRWSRIAASPQSFSALVSPRGLAGYLSLASVLLRLPLANSPKKDLKLSLQSALRSSKEGRCSTASLC